MLTDKPHIVFARAPRRARKPAARKPWSGKIVGPHERELAPASPPERNAARGKPAAKPAAVIVGRKVAPQLPTDVHRDHARAEAAERLWKELVRRASRK
jgi:hypothetical protein